MLSYSAVCILQWSHYFRAISKIHWIKTEKSMADSFLKMNQSFAEVSRYSHIIIKGFSKCCTEYFPLIIHIYLALLLYDTKINSSSKKIGKKYLQPQFWLSGFRFAPNWYDSMILIGLTVVWLTTQPHHSGCTLKLQSAAMNHPRISDEGDEEKFLRSA